MVQIDERPLDSCVAVVTGASSGIGTAAARKLASEGASIVLCARRIDRLNELADELRGRGATAVGVEADLSDPKQAARVIDDAAEALGQIDVLVNNAGVMHLGTLKDAEPDELSRMIDVNLTATIQITKAAMPYLIAAAESRTRQCADIVNVSSVAGRVARGEAAVYSATKFGVCAFSSALRQELAGVGVRVTVVEPGTVDTELISHVREDARARALAGVAGVRRLDADDVADVIAFAVSRPRHISLNELLLRPTQEAG
jgi:NADP-dependent 3-hydroxy acid dehydrogenase YdfG